MNDKTVSSLTHEDHSGCCGHDHDSYGPETGIPFVRGQKIGRNDPCFCGSSKKYKKCCLGG